MQPTLITDYSTVRLGDRLQYQFRRRAAMESTVYTVVRLGSTHKTSRTPFWVTSAGISSPVPCSSEPLWYLVGRLEEVSAVPVLESIQDPVDRIRGTVGQSLDELARSMGTTRVSDEDSDDELQDQLLRAVYRDGYEQAVGFLVELTRQARRLFAYTDNSPKTRGIIRQALGRVYRV